MLVHYFKLFCLTQNAFFGGTGVKLQEQHLAAPDALIAPVIMCWFVKGKITDCRLSFPFTFEHGKPEYNPVSKYDPDRPIVGSCQNPINTWWDVGQTLRRG